ncbi:MAG: flagellar hook-associated protein FlgK [Butyrivibrio sp.]|nr:flagellar hook-associated protein FlgK [Muribaculum sp.]MCM1551353.1 flagellar hook-associated protein FlgK [Butyrivibrio sp.]
MPSQFFGLNIAYTGLLASNAALNTTSNNIANVQTNGYSRQQVVQQAANALQVFQTYGCAGAGVETLAIERIRDEFYDVKFWNNNTNLGEYEMKQYYMKQIETYFYDTGDNAGFKTVFDQLMITGLQAMMNDPSSNTTKEQFVGYADSLMDYFNGLAGNMEALQKDVNQEIKLKVDEMNSIAGEIANLNKQINTIELTGVNANELRDRRTLLIDQLSKIVDVQVTETPIIDTNNPDHVTGANRFVVKIAAGQLLVDGNEYRGLQCVARTNYEKVNQTDIDGLYDVEWEDGQKFNLYNAAMGGDLKGLVEMRDGNNTEYFHGTITELGETTVPDPSDDTKTVTVDTVTIEVGQTYLQDLNKCNLSDQGGMINLGNQVFYYDAWEYNYNAITDTYSYTFTLSPTGENGKNDTRVTNDRLEKEASIGVSLDYQGIPYYMNQMNEWLRTFAQKFNDIITSGVDAQNRKGLKVFTADHTIDDEQYDFPDEYRYDQVTQGYQDLVEQKKQELMKADATLSAGDAEKQAKEAIKTEYETEVETRKQELITNNGMSDSDAAKQAQQEVAAEMGVGITIDYTDDSYYRMTAKNANVTASLVADPSMLANKYTVEDGVEQNDLLEDLKKMVNDKSKASFRGSTCSEFLQNVLSDVALNASRANLFAENYAEISENVENQRISISGVDEDEEAVNLVKYQNGYNLASKMIQILTEIYDRLILETGV